MNPRDTALLDRAFAEADKAEWLWTAPNPRVGALALCKGHVVGFGFHQRFAEAHAEEAALRDAGAIEEGGSIPGMVDEIIVSLEPCSARGGAKKRRPCLDWLLEAGVKRVVIGAMDPDPRHQGAAVDKLRAAGMEVICANAQQRFEDQNPAFMAALQNAQRPWILLKWAASLDGRTAAANGVSQWITGSTAREEVHELRAIGHGVMAGKATVAMDNPQLTARDSEGNCKTELARVLVGASECVNPDSALLANDCPRIWIEAEGQQLPNWITSADHLIHAPRNANGQLDLVAAMASLKSDFQINRLLVEGGAQLHGSLLAAGLADAIIRYEAPLLMGGGLGSVSGEGVDHPRDGWRLLAEERLQLGEDLRRAFLIQGAT
ncbi:MAG: bifunctional diaminohydroxyphosphoribosylaminopyrimidine deaminase/5-amino-6-(5-phosphoribosylamino)uracil reductase RibD [Planctomycetes bacterium]|nr:bifunctional diaminohydroxyphosphoribosylaminopyrimidine deaminase/5-amino-6-(5-phosphoribosylamino)uracil reductase RibD [Planctomycetota bacterium]MCP4860137.1 bifunctional diaminohydroxyphosphoribosylaminopyrimidine deaminase/5-amino-6-(5-phosphoribosylamino)uracil reductase RibD [Planctomycetota bacterium]